MAIMDECKNRFVNGKCNQWIIDTFETLREFKTGENKDKTDHVVPRDYPGKADEICAQCNYFERKSAANKGERTYGIK
ncbi:MAG: hypothetical protein J7K66_00230 [Anaerolineaceae bacterium]|nr:hypothetical protein [Anaerolineaceae bacterium]